MALVREILEEESGILPPSHPLHWAWVLGGRGRQSLPPALSCACEQRGTRR